jgi:pilus assembly protein FimV
MRSTLKPWVVALGLALVAQIAPAAGFGRINVSSALGQPLAAEIDLLNVSPEDLAGMQVRLAPPESFRDANVELSPALTGVRFVIEKRANGQPFIRVTSSQPISEPAINLLVEVTWPSGRLLRDYPVLLNPAGYTQTADAGVRVAPSLPEIPIAAKPAPVADKPAIADKAAPPAASVAPAAAPRSNRPSSVAKAESKPESKPEAKTEAAATNAQGGPAGAPGESYTIKPGDTLRALAANNRPASASLEQTMLAMFEASRASFINDSIHRIRAGKKLHLPTTQEATAVAADEASRRLNLLATDFDAYRKRLADSASAKPAGTSAEKGTVSGKLTAQTEDAARPAKPGGSDVLQVSRGAAKAAETGQAQRKTAADERASRLEEEAVARENQLREAKERVAALETNLAQMRKLVGDKDKPAAGEKSAPAPTPVATLPAIPTPEAVKPLAPPVAEAPKPATAAVAEAGKPVDAAKAVDAVKPAEAKAAPVEASFWDALMGQLSDNPMAIGGGVASFLLVSWLGINRLRRQRERTEELFAPTTSSPEPMTVNAVTVEKASALVDTGNGAYASEFERVVPDHQVDEVDPVAEADVYIAYGRDVQAEEILKEAMAKDPERTEILMKLLEIYAQRKSIDEYAQHALQLRDRVGTGHPLWSAAMAMGYEIDPTNALYQGAGEELLPLSIAVPQVPESLDLDLTEAADDSGAHETLHSGEPLPEFDPDLTLMAPPVAGVPAVAEIGETQRHHLALLEIGEPVRPDEHADAAERGDQDQTVAHPRHAAADGELPADGELDADAAETLRALSAISAESLRAVESPRTEAGNSWPSLPEVAAFGGMGVGTLSLAANHEATRAPEGDPFTLDFELSETTSKASAASLAHGNAALDLGKIDLDLAADPAPSSPPTLTLVPGTGLPAVAAVPGESAIEAKSFGDIDLELKESQSDAPEASAVSPAPEPQEQNGQWHNVATKLDLARAYLEIGDKDGAREILREVSAEGDEAQREEAERLAVQI